MQNPPSTTHLFLRRLAALFYDCLLLIAIYFVITAIVISLNEGEAVEHWTYKMFLVLVAYLFFDWFWRHGGQTLGMRAWRIRLEGHENESITMKQTFVRYFSGLCLWGLTLFLSLIHI